MQGSLVYPVQLVDEGVEQQPSFQPHLVAVYGEGPESSCWAVWIETEIEKARIHEISFTGVWKSDSKVQEKGGVE